MEKLWLADCKRRHRRGLQTRDRRPNVPNGNDLGEILEIIEQPHQLLGRINWKGKEALIPLNEQFLQKVDKRKKQVLVELPEGLLEVFE